MMLRDNLFRASCIAKTRKDTVLEDSLIEAFDVIDDCYKRVCKV